MSPAETASNAAASPRSAALRYQLLRSTAPVSLRRAACLAVRARGPSCRACAEACPTRALAVGEQHVDLNGACTGCGRCQAACPMGALSVAGFDALGGSPAPRHGDRWVVACERAATAEPGALRVPCLGGLSDGRLLALCADAPEAVLVLADAGECSSCDSGGADHPARAAVQRLEVLMREVGVPEARLPRIERSVGSATRRGWWRAADPLQVRGRARRGLFSALAQAASPSAERLAASASSPERRTQLEALRSLAARHGGRLPAALFHRVEIGDACRGHRVCASACPTGALVRYREAAAARSGVAFDGEDCIGCGHCTQACPEQAIAVHPGAGAPGSGRQPLSRFIDRDCAECGARFAARESETHTRCDRCLKSERLAHSAFHSLFRARP